MDASRCGPVFSNKQAATVTPLPTQKHGHLLVSVRHRSKTTSVSVTGTWRWPALWCLSVVRIIFQPRDFWIPWGSVLTWWIVITWKPFLRIKVVIKGQSTLWLTALYFVKKMAKNETNLLDKNRVDKTIDRFQSCTSAFLNLKECRQED